MTEETITMTQKAVDRPGGAAGGQQAVMAAGGGLPARPERAADQAPSARYRAEGPSGLVRPLPDFGPTLACEKLAARHWHKLSAETLRQWMIAEGLWKPRARKSARIHQRRAHAARSGRASADRRLTP